MRRVWIIFALVFVAALPVCYVAAMREYYRCEKEVYVHPQMGAFYYWKWIHRSVSHGICAEMSGGKDGKDGEWEVEIPHPGDPTAIYPFNTREESEAWAEKHCYSRDKEWKLVTH